MASNLSLSRHGDERADAVASLVVDHIASYQASEDSLLSVASTTTQGPICYLRNRDRSLELLGIGCVASFQSDSLEQFRATFDWLIPVLRSHPQRDSLFLLGGTSFDGDSPGDEWQGFGAVHFMIPRCLFVRKGTIVDVFLSSEHTAPNLTHSLSPDSNCSVSWERTEPSPEGWVDVIAQALDQIANGSFEKVVLARRSDAKLDKPVHPANLLKQLLSSPQRVAGFAFAPGIAIDRCFFGATPELLFTLDDAALVSEAVAGTLPRTSVEHSPTSEDCIRRSASPKERMEHDYVVSAIVNRLHSIGAQVTAAPEPSITPLHDLYHLVTPIHAQLPTVPSPFDLIALLHPTPAVCGSPCDPARDFIRHHESFNRGWYAGTIGYINGCRAEFSVGLRSALLDGQKLSAYVGAGIVSGSTPAREWEELDLKQRRLEESLARVSGERSGTVKR